MSHQKWEYRVTSVTIESFNDNGVEEFLNQLGLQNWELVEIISRASNDSNFTDVTFYLKRPRLLVQLPMGAR